MAEATREARLRQPGGPISSLGDHLIGNTVERHMKQLMVVALAFTAVAYFFTDHNAPGFLSTYVYESTTLTSYMSMLPVYGSPQASKLFIAWLGAIGFFLGMWPNAFAQWAEDHFSLPMQSSQVVALVAFPCFGTLFIDVFKGLFWVHFAYGFLVSWAWHGPDAQVYKFWTAFAKWNLFFLGWSAHAVMPISNFYHAKLISAYIVGWCAYGSLGLTTKRKQAHHLL